MPLSIPTRESDPVVFVREYLDLFDGENFDGRGIKSATIISAEWITRVVSQTETLTARASIRQNGRRYVIDAWNDGNPAGAGSGHFFDPALNPRREDD